MVLQNPLPVQGLVATTPPPQANSNAPGAPPTIETGFHHLLAMTTKEVNLQTRRNQYGTTTEPTDTLAASTSKKINLTLQLPPFSHPPIHRISNNTMEAAVSYSIVDYLAQTPTTMSALEVLKMFPMQWKALLATLGAVDRSESKLITFNTENRELHMPSTIAFQIPVSIQNLVVHRCIVDEGASMCIMSTLVWKKLGSPILQPSSTTLWDYDGHPTKSQGILPHVPITLSKKTVLIDIENEEPHFPSTISFQILVSIRNLVVH